MLWWSKLRNCGKNALDYFHGRHRKAADWVGTSAAGGRRDISPAGPHASADRSLARRHSVSWEEHDILFSTDYFDSGQRGVVSHLLRDQQDGEIAFSSRHSPVS